MFIRREKEYNNIKEAYRKLQETGTFQLRLITGEAGSGKTMLSNIFMKEVMEEAEQTLFVSCFCYIRSEYNIPYQPFKELLKHLLQDVKKDEELHAEEKTKKDKIKEALSFSARMICEHAPDLIGNFVPGASILSIIGQAVFKDKEKAEVATIEESKILEQYLDVIRAITERYKLVIFIDDLQWVDKLSVNLLYQLILGLQNSPVMIIGAYRSTDIASEGINHPLSKLLTEVKINYGNIFINLDLLSKAECRDFMNRILDIEPNIYDAQFREKLFERTNGNPLFVSELMNLLKESNMIIQNNDGIWMNNANLVWNSYPVRIEGIIQERIGKLEDSLIETLSHASVQGYNFIAQVLSKTMGEPEKDVLITLSKKLQKQYNLVLEGSCIRSTKGIVSHYNFSNYIFQQYLYQELSMSQRIMLHSDIAGILEELFKDNYEEVAADIAQHYEISGENEKALHYMKITIENMMRISAYEEASVIIGKALQILENIEQNTNTKKEKLWFTVKLCICYRSTKGWGNMAVETLYQKAKEISKEIQDYAYMDTISFGIWTIHLTRLELDKCLQLAYKYLNTAQKHGNIQSEMNIRIALINTLFWMGNITETSIQLSEYNEFIKNKQLSNDPLNSILYTMFSLLIAYQQCEEEQVNTYWNELVHIANTEKDHFYKTIALQALSWHSWIAGKEEELELYAKPFLELSQKYNFLMYIGIAKMLYGASLVHKEADEAIHLIKEGYKTIINHCETSFAVMHILYGYILSNTYLVLGKHEEFISFINNIIEEALERNEKCYLNELNLLKAKYYHKINEADKSLIFINKSLETAQLLGSIKGEEKVRLILTKQNHQ